MEFWRQETRPKKTILYLHESEDENRKGWSEYLSQEMSDDWKHGKKIIMAQEVSAPSGEKMISVYLPDYVESC